MVGKSKLCLILFSAWLLFLPRKQYTTSVASKQAGVGSLISLQRDGYSFAVELLLDINTLLILKGEGSFVKLTYLHLILFVMHCTVVRSTALGYLSGVCNAKF